MGQLVAGVAGAVVGTAIGIGPAAGFALGSSAYSLLNPQQINGPKLGDTKIQISSYGAALGLVYGGWRKAGNVIWAADLVGTESTESGKGGPEVTTTSYTASFAVALAETQHAGVRRIWAGGKLVYDITDATDGPGQAASALFGSYFTFYPGSETQLPDPTLEAVFGAGNVPAFRGVCYLVFTDLPVGDFGNTLPQLQVELTNQDPETIVADELLPLGLGPWTPGMPEHETGDTEYVVTGATNYTGTSLAAALAALQANEGGDYSNFVGYYTSTDPLLSIFGGDAGLNDGLGVQYVYLGYSPVVPDIVVPDGLGAGGESDQEYCTPVGTCPGAGSTPAVMASSYPADIQASGPYTSFSGHRGTVKIFVVGPGGPNIDDPMFALYGEAGANCLDCLQLDMEYFSYAVLVPNKFIRAERLPTAPTQTCEIGDPCLIGIAQIPGNAEFCIACDGEVSPNYAYTLEAGSYVQLQDLRYEDGAAIQLPRGPVLRTTDPENTEAFWEAQALAAGVTGTYGIDYPVAVSEASVSVSSNTQVSAGAALLSDVVEDLCLRTGKLTVGQLDLAALNDVVRGYGIGRQASARANLEPLRQAYFFDLIESEGLIKAVKRGGEVVATIGPDDLGAGEGEAAAYLTEPMRQQEAELPATLVVAYAAADTDYQTGTQRERRITTLSDQQAGVELPVVLTDQKAAEVTAVLMYDAWVGRTTRKWSTTRKWCHLEPGDLVNLDDGEFTVLVRLVDKLESGPVIEWLSVDEDVASYTPNVSPSLTAGDGSVIRFAGPTKLELLDIPMLRDADNDAGHYAAASGYRSDWRGGRAFRSLDGVSYATLQDFRNAATLGYCTSTLGTHAGGNTLDLGSTLTVRLHNGALSSVTDAQLLAGDNYAVIGSEVLQFRGAELVGERLYNLRGFLRGRLGSEWAIGEHVANERFVLLTADGLRRIAMDNSERGVEFFYKAVSFGDSLADATAQAFTNNAVALMPYAPENVRALIVAGTQDIAVDWNRRSRFSARLFSTVPLGEATESYEVDVIDVATDEVIRTLPASAETVTYTEAQQVADGIGPGDPLRFDVYQLSDMVGRGYVASVDGAGA